MSAKTIKDSVAELVSLYRASGKDAANRRASEISQTLTYPECIVLKTEFWRALEQ